MTNETYNILNLIVNIFIALGTVGAVILSLYFARKEKEVIKIVNVNISKTNKEWRNPKNREEILHEMDFYINIDLICENYIDKTIEIYTKKIIFNEFILENKEKQNIPNYGRGIKLVIFKNYPKKLMVEDNLQAKRNMEEDLKCIKDSNIIRVDFETNIGNFCYYLNRRQVNKIKKDLKKPPIVTLSL